MSSALLVCGLFLSCAGLGYFLYGRKQEHVVAKYSGLALMIYPYFMDDIWVLLAVGLGLLLLPKFLRL